MGDVIQFSSRAAVSDNMRALQELVEMEKRGELGALITIHEGPEGNALNMTGAFADRMQYGAFSIVKALNKITDLIDQAGTAGHSYSPALLEQAVSKKRTMIPRRLAQTTGFGELQ